MKLTNLESANPACVLALAGVMRITGARSRWCDNFQTVELDRSLSAVDFLPAATARRAQLSRWPDDASADWWLTQAKTTDDPDASATICMLGTPTSKGGWAHSQWRMIFGQQRWLKMIREALREVDSRMPAWLSATHWPRDHYMGMTGVDCGAYCPPAYNWTSNTSKLSKGNPVSLWLMWEGMHMLPSVPISGMVDRAGRWSDSPHGYASLGWRDRNSVRWPLWTQWADNRSLQTLWSCEQLYATCLDARLAPYDPHPTIREMLTGWGIGRVMESWRAAQPPPYAWRLQYGSPL